MPKNNSKVERESEQGRDRRGENARILEWEGKRSKSGDGIIDQPDIVKFTLTGSLGMTNSFDCVK